jgi:stage II sporulation protein M
MNLRKEYSISWKTLKKARRYIYFSMALFFLSSIIAGVFSSHLGFIDDLLRNLISQTEGLNAFELMWFIFSNNTKSALFAFILGAIFGIPTLINIIANGGVLGYVLAVVLQEGSILDWWRLLPHGVFELPAIFLSFGLGLWLGTSLFVRKKRLEELQKRFIEGLRVFFLVVLPLLIIAAIIEGILIALS